MARISYPKELEDLYLMLNSEKSEERSEAALMLQMNTDKFPTAGTINGSRAKAKKAVILPMELLSLLMLRAAMYENVLKELVKRDLQQDGLLEDGVNGSVCERA